MQEAPVWLLPAALDAIHLRQLAEHGGTIGVRDPDVLRNALARPPRLHARDGGADLAAPAAAYGHDIARGHPFVDGNTRTALVATLSFLRLNGCDLSASPTDRCLALRRLAGGQLDESGFAAWIRRHLTRTP